MKAREELLIDCIKKREELPDPRIGLRPLLKEEKMESYIKLCVDRIRTAGLIDGKAIDFDLADPYNLLLNADGMANAFDILTGYCDEKVLEQYMSILKLHRKLFIAINEQAIGYRQTKKSALRNLARTDFGEDASLEALSFIGRAAKAELDARKLHNVVIRNFGKFATRIHFIWKFRHQLALVLKTQYLVSKN